MKHWVIFLLLASVLASATAEGLPEGVVISREHQENVMKYLRPALMAHGGAGRLYYSTACAAKDGTPLPFPEVQVRPSSKGMTGLAAVRDIFKNDNHVKVSQSGSGMIRVRIGHPAISLLQTRISSVSFKPEEQYNGELAIWAIMNSSDVAKAMRQLGWEQPETIFGGSINAPEEGTNLPHLPASLKNVTMDQALDVIAKTFGGIAVYETCVDPSGKRLVSLDFVAVAELLR